MSRCPAVRQSSCVVVVAVVAACAASVTTACSARKQRGTGAGGAGDPAAGDGANSETGGAAAACGRPSCPQVLYERSRANVRRGLEVDDNDLFWCEITNEEGNVVRAAPKSGAGPVRTLGKWDDFASTSALVVDRSHVYWMRNDDGQVLVRVDKSGGGEVTTRLPTGVAGARLDVGPLRDGGDFIAIATQGCTTIARIPKDGSAPAVFPVSTHPNGGVTTGLDVAGGIIYCSNKEFIHALDPRTGGSSEIVRGQKYAGPMAWIDGSLYFVNDRGASGSGENLSVLRAGAAVDAAEDLGAAFGFVDRLLYDGKRRSLYWTTGFHWLVSKVVVYRLDGGAPTEVLFDNQDVMGGSAADADALYWLSDHHVTRLAKEP